MDEAGVGRARPRIRDIDGGWTRSWVGQLARRPYGVRVFTSRTEHGEYEDARVVIAALLAQASSQLHHGRTGGRPRGSTCSAPGCGNGRHTELSLLTNKRTDASGGPGTRSAG